MLLGGNNFSLTDTVGTPGGAIRPVVAPVGSVRTTTATTGGGAAGSGIPAERRQQLMQGLAPSNAAEQAWVGAVQAVYDVLVSEVVRLAQSRSAYAAGRQVAEDSSFEAQVLQLVNVERARYGLQPLSYDQRLDMAAESHNMQQATTRTMAHDGIGDGDPGSRIRATGFRQAWGENVATGQLSPAQVVQEWMASPGHRRNILDPSYRLLGVSYLVGGDGRTYWAQEFGAAG